VPWLQTVYDRFKSQNLNVVGLTKVNRSATDTSVRQFIDDNDITYPIFKEDGSARQHFDMQGTPYMAMVRNGLLVWEKWLDTEQFPEEIVARFVEASM
jgi:hypothetical protein